jgi:hypothetical protein
VEIIDKHCVGERNRRAGGWFSFIVFINTVPPLGVAIDGLVMQSARGPKVLQDIFPATAKSSLMLGIDPLTKERPVFSLEKIAAYSFQK